VGKIIAYIVLGLGTAVFFYLLPLAWLYPWNLKDLIKRDAPKKGDVIVILEGAYYSRIDRALELYRKGYAPLLYYPSPSYDVNIEYIRQKTAELGIGDACIMGTAQADSTFREALAVKRFLGKRPAETVLLVTSPYHSYRAWWVFSNVLRGVEIVSVPSHYPTEWKTDGTVDPEHRHARYAPGEKKKFAASYILYGLLFQ
jgi:uncharacterized SAM-binding protein YcdF (DUF218 family)